MPLYIGLMSGTSADAIDAALVSIDSSHFQVIKSISHPIPSPVRTEILNLFDPGANEIDRMGSLDRTLGELFSEAASELLTITGVHSDQVHAIGSHGQTIRHRPRPNSGSPFTLQIGDPNTIAERTGITTIADFRRRDVACGGQGAPLTPAFHEAVFGNKLESRGVLNIGGIANITLLAPGIEVIGFDTGPGNGLMDAWIDHCLLRSYDQNGEWAASGKIHRDLLAQLLSHPFFKLAAPKSTGREEFTLTWLMTLLEGLGNIANEDVQTTLAELTALSISDQLRPHGALSKLFLCGGGAHNIYLIRRIQASLPNCKILTTDVLGIPVGDVEAAAFAWLAYQTMAGLTGNLTSVTGARKSVILGGIYPK